MVGVVSARYIANGTTLRVRRASASASLTELGRFLGVKYYQFSFLDLFGSQRSKLVPVSYADDIARSGAGFAGFACNLRMAPTDGDLLAIPDPLSVTVLPWNKDVAWMACNLEWRGTVLDHGPRNVLRLVLGLLRDRGLTMKTGVECEFFLLDKEGSSLADALDTADKPCYEAHTLMRRFDVVSELVDAMESLGWGVYQADHEDANGQFEINWHYADALVTADRVTFFKYMVRSIAEKHGLRATFMPKPFANLTGSGCHCHISVHDATEPAAPNVFKSGERLGFNPSGESFGLNRRALSFLGGLLAEAQALAAVANPTINSYKRIHASTTTSGATWSPNTICWGGNNRTVMVIAYSFSKSQLTSFRCVSRIAQGWNFGLQTWLPILTCSQPLWLLRVCMAWTS